mmetsp:Transcript_36697/g.96865  ORF Transcript_36697/g.96865 Transcript_36697/m.96865 type:complete len:123 (+) Transcript_36697:99-467(+)
MNRAEFVSLLLCLGSVLCTSSKLRSWRTPATFVGGTAPSNRYTSGAALTDDNKLIIYGGCGAAGRLSDMHLLDLSAFQWNDLDSASALWPTSMPSTSAALLGPSSPPAAPPRPLARSRMSQR